MLAATAKTKRFLEVIQLVLSFVSVCAVIDAGLVPQQHLATGYHASAPGPLETHRDRRLTDLARAERQRREAEQLASRGRAGIEAVRLAPGAA